MGSIFKLIILAVFIIYSVTVLCSYLSDSDTNDNIFTQIIQSGYTFFRKLQNADSPPRINGALYIRENSAAMSAKSTLGTTQGSLTQSLQRISSGLRINRAADDAAGLGVRQRMDSDISSLNQAIRNTNDGISLVQTAEGGLNEQYNILVRMRELAVQASNNAYTSHDRKGISTEFIQLIDEFDRIANVTNFNDVYLLDGSGDSEFKLQVGIDKNSNDTIKLDLSTST